MANPMLQRMTGQQELTRTETKISDIYEMVRRSGKSPKDFFYAMCASRGVDPNKIIEEVKKHY